MENISSLRMRYAIEVSIKDIPSIVRLIKKITKL